MVSAWWLLAAFWAGVCVGVVLVALFSKVDAGERAELPQEPVAPGVAKRAEPGGAMGQPSRRSWSGIGAAGRQRKTDHHPG